MLKIFAKVSRLVISSSEGFLNFNLFRVFSGQVFYLSEFTLALSQVLLSLAIVAGISDLLVITKTGKVLQTYIYPNRRASVGVGAVQLIFYRKDYIPLVAFPFDTFGRS